MTPDPPPRGQVSRRSFLQTMGVSAAAAAVQAQAERADAAQPSSAPTTLSGPGPIEITLNVNGSDRRLTIDPATTLMEALRWHAGLTGTKEVCDRAACGTCSVLIDGRLVNSCMMLAYDAQGSRVTTIEGLARPGSLDPIQESFIRHDALQCGYCTPGLILASKALLGANPRPTLDQIKKGLAGNICRCGTYTNVFNAVLDASGQSPLMDSEAPDA
ncbi:MAG: (2Fe-2S)-binding protein [Phycisphaeraceae bacterium]|nr:(2Fe-2S)-binding protein [Phycisphaeraceae bacterium]